MSVKKQYRFQRDYFHPELLRLRGPGKIQMLDGCMRMCLVPGTLSERKETAFVALRQQHDRDQDKLPRLEVSQLAEHTLRIDDVADSFEQIVHNIPFHNETMARP